MLGRGLVATRARLQCLVGNVSYGSKSGKAHREHMLSAIATANTLPDVRYGSKAERLGMSTICPVCPQKRATHACLFKA